jgi:hypothetical protein
MAFQQSCTTNFWVNRTDNSISLAVTRLNLRKRSDFRQGRVKNLTKMWSLHEVNEQFLLNF